MRYSLASWGAAMLLLAACQAADRNESTAADAVTTATADVVAEEKAVRAQIERWLQLVKAKDAGAIAALYADDGMVMPPNAPSGKGAAAIEQIWAGMMATPGFDLIFVPDQIVISSSGDMALDRGTYRLSMAPGGKPMTDTGKYVVVWRKMNGTWKAAADIFNSDLPAGGS
jgi:uncharacterized protein (TIGR02246 family)